MSVLDQADNPRRLVTHDDDSVVSSCAYPYATVLGGMSWRVQGDRLLRPLHKIESQSHSWGVCITSASGGEELHLYSTQVIKDLSSLDPSSLAHVPFQGNGSQLRHMAGFPNPGREVGGQASEYRRHHPPLPYKRRFFEKEVMDVPLCGILWGMR